MDFQLVGTSVSRDASTKGKSAVEIVEEATRILRSAPVRLLPRYYIGSLPFVLGLVYFWADMSRNPFAADHCSAAALGLALLFVWMKGWHSAFCRQLRAEINDRTDPPQGFPNALRIAANQAFIHATGLIALPVGMAFMVPFAWWYAFYQNATVLDDGNAASLKTLLRNAWRQAKLWPEQNHALILMLSGLGFFVFVNLSVSLIWLPEMTKRFFGIETLLTTNVWWVFNTTFLTVVTALTYLCIDPLLKTAYVLRCHYGFSLRTGEDLMCRLSRSAKVSGRMAIVVSVAVILGLAGSDRVAAEVEKHASVAAPSVGWAVEPETLDASIAEVMRDPRFAWRLPREPEVSGDRTPGWLQSFFQWTEEKLKQIFRPIGRWIERLFDWLTKRVPRPPERKSEASQWPQIVKWLLMLLSVIIVGALALLFWRRFQSGREAAVDARSVPEAKPVPDIGNEQTRADDLPVDQWLELAARLIREGNWLLAMRAYYFAVLSRLAAGDLLTIAMHKSNQEYELELRRRVPDQCRLHEMFAQQVNRLDRAWYGSQRASEQDVRFFAATQERIFSVVER